MKKSRILLFGGRGAIGGALLQRFVDLGCSVTATSRQEVAPSTQSEVKWIVCDPAQTSIAPDLLDAGAPYDAVIWAQGANCSDSVLDVDPERHLELYQANCLFVLQTLRLLLNRNLLAPAARLVVVSSIWQTIARPNKLSYIMTKAAIGGLVQSASVDLAGQGFLINAVLPSALDTPMTRSNLHPDQIKRLAGETGFGRLSSLDDVVATIEFLCSPRNTGVTGQSIAIDLGFSHARLV
ncbi:SDR family NAD(P)-dependent oxidoreductase [Acetobacter okinawensis]|uniref:SDR family NAD(P)-dependent oxidoreductase n=1 Tax=Acetobacter okinawensis TaxID=1076594 RepID=UPI00209DC6D5|nr:SDR family oxidoreductase [Acetobacter okinawensis]MCP1212458.1 SDR family oxidoreductase [Acetobacter okinawensis]